MGIMIDVKSIFEFDLKNTKSSVDIEKEIFKAKENDRIKKKLRALLLKEMTAVRESFERVQERLDDTDSEEDEYIDGLKKLSNELWENSEWETSYTLLQELLDKVNSL